MSNWMLKNAWKKITSPQTVSDFKIKNTLEIFGIAGIEYKLSSDNEAILVKYISIVSSLSRHSIEISKEMLEDTIKFLALCFENKQKRVVVNAAAAMTLYFNNFEFKISGIASKADIKDAVKSGNSKINNIEFCFPHSDHPQKVEKMFKGWVLGLFNTCESLM